MISKIRKYLNQVTEVYVRKRLNMPILGKKQRAMSIMFSAMDSWNKTEGEYLEFGVYKGRSFQAAYKEANKRGLDDMKFFAFDSFKGLPPVNGTDAEHNYFREGQFACSEETFLENLKKKDVDLTRVETIPGFYEESLTEDRRKELNIDQVAVAWIDCDIYESTVPVLDFLTPIIKTGTFLAFDDWFSFAGDPHAGQIRAVREWVKKNGHITLEHYRDFGKTGRIFLVQKWNN